MVNSAFLASFNNAKSWPWHCSSDSNCCVFKMRHCTKDSESLLKGNVHLQNTNCVLNFQNQWRVQSLEVGKQSLIFVCSINLLLESLLKIGSEPFGQVEEKWQSQENCSSPQMSIFWISSSQVQANKDSKIFCLQELESQATLASRELGWKNVDN